MGVRKVKDFFFFKKKKKKVRKGAGVYVLLQPLCLLSDVLGREPLKRSFGVSDRRGRTGPACLNTVLCHALRIFTVSHCYS